MRFEDVTERLGGIVEYPGDKADGLPLNAAIPHMAKMRIWRAQHGGYSWCISHEPGEPGWTDEQRQAWAGYTASYRRLEHNNSSQTIRIDGGPWDPFTKAEAACKAVWRQLRSPQ